MEVKTSKFVRRQTRESEFAYYNGEWEVLEEIAFHLLYIDGAITPGYRDGVILLRVPESLNENFYSSVVPITDDLQFETIFEPRRDGENPVKKSVAYGKKIHSKTTDIVIYSKDVLEEDPLNKLTLTGADWEIVSINCSPYEYSLPMTPTTKARNILACTDHPFGRGGSCDPNSSAKDLAECVAFWTTHTMIREK